MFVPPALWRATVERESILIRDLTAPARDWLKFDPPTITRTHWWKEDKCKSK